MPHPHLPLCFNFTLYVCVKFWTSMCQRCWCSPTRHTTTKVLSGRGKREPGIHCLHMLNFSEILGDRELSCCIRTTVTFITCNYYYTVRTFSDQWWSSFDWGRDSHLSDAAFSGYFLWTIFLSPHHSLFLETVSTGNFKGGARSAQVPLLPLWLHVCTRTHS